MADDRRQQLAEVIASQQPQFKSWGGRPNYAGLCLADALLPLLDRVAADAAAEALEAWAAKHYCSVIDDGMGGYECGWCGSSWAHTLPGGPGCPDARALRARAAELRAPARTDEEN